MKIAVYGGSFNPPHLGHLEAAKAVADEFCPDKLLIIPDCIPPHKEIFADSPSPMQRLELCRLNFEGIDCAEISDIEILRDGKSYTAETIAKLREDYGECELSLVVGTDMLLSFESWYNFPYLFEQCELLVMPRDEDDIHELNIRKAEYEKKYGARIRILSHVPLPMSSTEIRAWLPRRMGSDTLRPEVYASIIKNGYYGALPELTWLRGEVMPYLSSNRLAHVAGCESEAVLLAMQYGEDSDSAAEAAILHDITKRLSREEHLNLCAKYGIVCDKSELDNPKLLHAITGSALARDVFGVCDEIAEAIRWHTTGKPDMTLLEKIIYLADYIEPNRDFPGVDKLRELAYEDIDEALVLGFEMSLEEVRSHGVEPHRNTAEAYEWYKSELLAR